MAWQDQHYWQPESRTSSGSGNVFIVSTCLNTLQLIPVSGQGLECSALCPAVDTPKGCLWQKMVREHQDPAVDTFSHSVSSDCNWTGMAPAPSKSQLFSLVKKKKNKCGRGRAEQIITSSSTVRIFALLGGFPSPCLEKQDWKQRTQPSLSVKVCTPVWCWAFLEHCSNFQLSLPEPLFGAVCKLRQKSLLWLPSRNSEVAERECKEGTVQLHHIYLTTTMKHQN